MFVCSIADPLLGFREIMDDAPGSDDDLAIRHVNKRARKAKGAVAVFDENARRCGLEPRLFIIRRIVEFCANVRAAPVVSFRMTLTMGNV